MEQTDIICGQLHVIVSVQASENGIEDEKQVVNAFQQCNLHDKYSAATPNALSVLGERNSLPAATLLCARKQAVNGRDLSSSSPGAFQRRIGSMIETRGSVIEGMKKEEIIANLKKRREAFFETIKPKEEEETAGHQYQGNAVPIESKKKTLSDGDMKSKIASETSEVGERTDNIKKSSSSEGLFEADNRKGCMANKNEEASVSGETIVSEKQLRLNKQSRIQSMECHTGPRNYKADGTVITFADIVPPGVAASLSSAERKRQDIIYELIATEYQYVEDLLILIEVFLKPIREKQLLTKQELGIIFSNVEAIYNDVNKGLAMELIERRNESLIINNIADIFVKRGDLFKLYAVYCSNQPIIDEKLRELKAKYPDFKQFVDEAFLKPQCRLLHIDSFLINPLQRICKYPLLLRELLKYTSEDHSDHENLKNALVKINEVLDLINERTRRVENVSKIMHLQEKLETPNGQEANLVNNTRYLVREGEVFLRSKKGNLRKKLLLVLFTDSILMCKPNPKRGTFVIKQQIPIEQILVMNANKFDPSSQSNVDPGDLLIFEIAQIGHDMYRFEVATKQDASHWISDIQKVTIKALKETQKAEQGSLGSTSPLGHSPSVQPSSSASSPSAPISSSPAPSSGLSTTPQHIQPMLSRRSSGNLGRQGGGKKEKDDKDSSGKARGGRATTLFTLIPRAKDRLGALNVSPAASSTMTTPSTIQLSGSYPSTISRQLSPSAPASNTIPNETSSVTPHYVLPSIEISEPPSSKQDNRPEHAVSENKTAIEVDGVEAQLHVLKQTLEVELNLRSQAEAKLKAKTEKMKQLEQENMRLKKELEEMQRHKGKGQSPDERREKEGEANKSVKKEIEELKFQQSSNVCKCIASKDEFLKEDSTIGGGASKGPCEPCTGEDRNKISSETQGQTSERGHTDLATTADPLSGRIFEDSGDEKEITGKKKSVKKERKHEGKGKREDREREYARSKAVKKDDEKSKEVEQSERNAELRPFRVSKHQSAEITINQRPYKPDSLETRSRGGSFSEIMVEEFYKMKEKMKKLEMQNHKIKKKNRKFEEESTSLRKQIIALLQSNKLLEETNDKMSLEIQHLMREREKEEKDKQSERNSNKLDEDKQRKKSSTNEIKNDQLGSSNLLSKRTDELNDLAESARTRVLSRVRYFEKQAKIIEQQTTASQIVKRERAVSLFLTQAGVNNTPGGDQSGAANREKDKLINRDRVVSSAQHSAQPNLLHKSSPSRFSYAHSSNEASIHTSPRSNILGRKDTTEPKRLNLFLSPRGDYFGGRASADVDPNVRSRNKSFSCVTSTTITLHDSPRSDQTASSAQVIKTPNPLYRFQIPPSSTAPSPSHSPNSHTVSISGEYEMVTRTNNPVYRKLDAETTNKNKDSHKNSKDQQLSPQDLPRAKKRWSLNLSSSHANSNDIIINPSSPSHKKTKTTQRSSSTRKLTPRAHSTENMSNIKPTPSKNDETPPPDPQLETLLLSNISLLPSSGGGLPSANKVVKQKKPRGVPVRNEMFIPPHSDQHHQHQQHHQV